MIHVKQNPMCPLVPEYIQDFPSSPPVIQHDFNPPSQEDYGTTLDELENVISDIFLTLRGMRSKNYDL